MKDKDQNHAAWAEDYEAQKASGLTVKEWCAEKAIPENTFYQRLRIVRKEGLVGPRERTKAVRKAVKPVDVPAASFARLELPSFSSQGIMIRMGNTEINISPGSNTEHVKMVLEAIANA